MWNEERTIHSHEKLSVLKSVIAQKKKKKKRKKWLPVKNSQLIKVRVCGGDDTKL